MSLRLYELGCKAVCFSKSTIKKSLILKNSLHTANYRQINVAKAWRNISVFIPDAISNK